MGNIAHPGKYSTRWIVLQAQRSAVIVMLPVLVLHCQLG